jgi:outer membrane biosynthesis protein TonB
VGRFSASILAAVLSALAALSLVACGGGDSADLLPGGTASEITSNLDQVRELATVGDCVGAEDAAQAVSTQIEALGGVDEKLKQALREGATRLNEVVASCEEVETEEEETAPAIEEAIEPEADEKKEKAEKPARPEKPRKEEEAEEPAEETTTPTLPAQAEGKAKGHEKQEEEVPPATTEGGGASGGVGPGEPAGSE